MQNKTFADRYPVAFIIAAIDISTVLLAAQLAHWLRFGELVSRQDYMFVSAIVSLLVVICSVFSGLYESWRGRSKWNLIRIILLGWSIPFIILLVALVFTKQSEVFSRIWIGSWFVLSVFGSVVFRLSIYLLLSVVRANTRNVKTVFIIGSESHYHKVKSYFQMKPTYGYRVSGYLSLVSEGALSADDKNAVLQHIQDATPHEVWLCLPLTQAALVSPLLYTLRRSTADIRFVPNMDDMSLLNHRPRYVGDFFTLDLSCTPISGPARLLKRLEDLVLGGLISFMILPVLLVVALAVKMSSPGPILYKQRRDGLNGNKIKVYKFRSMRVHQEEQGSVTQATQGDSRVTRVGAFLRRTSLDELPQFFNVLQGRMSIVGPRPHAVAHNEYYRDLVESYMWRHKVKPGITGWAQVNGYRGETDTLAKMQGRVDHDLWYINNWSLWLDLKIIFLTVFKGFIHKNAY
jgi:Undecaprenyl-phosphate glucose phosphotransferase